MSNITSLLDSAAILIWLPPGIEPKGNFHLIDLAEARRPNAEPCWVLRDAIKYAMENQTALGKLPWIKVGSGILSPPEIATSYNALIRENN